MQMRVSSKRERVETEIINAGCCWDRVLLDRVIFTNSIFVYLPRLEDRAALARTSRAHHRMATRYDVALRQMWTTWAVPTLTASTRRVMLLESQLMPCIQWVHEKRRTLARIQLKTVSRTGYMEGVHYLMERCDPTSRFRYKSTVIDTAGILFRNKHVEKAVEFYSKYCKPLISAPLCGEYEACARSALRSCHPLADNHVLSCMTKWTEIKLHENGLWAGLLYSEDDVILYHWNTFTDVRVAIASMGKMARFTSKNAYGKAFALERVLQKGVTAEEFERIWG